ncbi:MAG: helix-turn-helix transcriptional regulator [Lysobacter sp.]|nr:helix-turn-helix transcriptional regulator [Lysobacter sp.]
MTTPTPPRPLTTGEIAALIRHFRGMRHWSQEQLAEISGLNIRTIQRVEQGGSASFDTRRALARAFDFDDIDSFNKPISVPSEDELRGAKEKFDRENIMLPAFSLTTGRQLAQLAEACEMDLSEPVFDLPRDAAELFAELVDAFREYRECSELYSEVQRIDLYEDLQSKIDELKAKGVSLRYAERKVQVGARILNAELMPMTVLYVLAFQLGKEPQQIATPRSAQISF